MKMPKVELIIAAIILAVAGYKFYPRGHQSNPIPPPPVPPSAIVQAADQCYQQLKYSPPLEKLPEDKKNKLLDCLAEQFPGFDVKKAMKNHMQMRSCLATRGITLPERSDGQETKLTDLQKVAVQACVKEIQSSPVH